MKDNYSFVNIRKRQDKLEDYTTELFVFLLNYLKYNNSPILEKILYEFGFRNKVDFDNLEFYTQQRLSHHDTKVIVDILIKYKTIKTIIEVKINSPLNMYKRNGKELKQIEYYEGIPDVQNVYLLSKRVLKIKKPENRILWSKVYSIINASDDFVVANFAKYLEEKGMGSIKLNEDDLMALISVSSFNTLNKLMVEAWPDDYDELYSLTSLSISPKKGYIGWYIKKDDERLIWMGIGGEKDGAIWTEILDEDIVECLKAEGEDEWALGSLDLNDIVNCETFEDQKIAVNDWFWEILEKRK
ncbi:MAG: hypothetical protein LBE17_14560 [Treponema sp.]|nr:hypothetical protein [Treponema sp.]